MSHADASAWKLLCTSVEVGRTPRPVQSHGEDLVVFRGASGAVRLLSAWCPHLGAHLGHGGVVEGDELVCPFHNWRFHETGELRCVPYSPRKAPKVGLTRWDAHEAAGLVFARPAQAANAARAQAPPPALDEDGWTRFRRVRPPSGLPGALRRVCRAGVREWPSQPIGDGLTLHEAPGMGLRLLRASDPSGAPITLVSLRRPSLKPSRR